MPDVDGWSVLRALKADPELCAIPVVLVTILGDREMGFALGAAEFVTKPVDPARLADVLARVASAAGGEGAGPGGGRRCRRRARCCGARCSRQGWRVTEAADGRECLGSAWAGPAPAAILLDLMMPGWTASRRSSAMRRGRTPGATIPVVVVTAKDLTPGGGGWLTRHAEAGVPEGRLRARAS